MSITTVDGRYEVIARIASGGMGEVFRAHDSVLAREVAVKVLHPALAHDRAFIERFRREARAAANLSHPNIVQVHDWGQRDGTSFMIMEYVAGPNLRDLLAAHRRLEPAQALEALLQMLAALDHAHRRGIVHRDVKPENALITPEGVVKVADFGLAHALAEARVTQSPGTVTGTVAYLAPEQIHGDPADPRTDLYALGVVAYELLAGRVPFAGETPLAVAYKHLSESIPPPSNEVPEAPKQLDRVVLRATSKDPDDRFPSAAEMRRDLVGIAASVPPATPLAQLVAGTPVREHEDRATTVTIPQVVAPRRGHRRPRRRRKWPWWVALVLVLLAGAWAAWTYAIPHYAKVPSVLGMRLEQARERLESEGLDVRVGPPVPSIEYPEETVARQSAAPDSSVREGENVVLHLSTGPPLRTVPAVKGLALEDATTRLDQHDLEVRVTRQYSLTVPKDEVMSQKPEPKARIPYGSSVELVVSKGPQPIQIPHVIGHTAEDAIAMLDTEGFDIERIDVFSSVVARGVVIRQHPATGTLPEGSTVTIVVSKGPRQFPMPNVKGYSRETAESQLSSLGLDVHVVVIPSTAGNTVVGQDPSPGTIVHPGNSVTIYVLA